MRIGEGKRARGNAAPISWHGERYVAQIRRIVGADQMNRWGALAVHPLAIHGVKCPRAIELEPAGTRNPCLRYRNRIQRFDGVELNIDQAGSDRKRGHAKSLANTVW